MKRHKTKKRFLLPLIAIAALLVVVDVAPKFYIDSKKTDIDSVNSLRSDLSLEAIDYSALSDINPVNIASRFTTLLNVNSEINKLADYQNQKDNIVKTFDDSISKYSTDISKCTQLDLAFLPKDSAVIDFQTKKDLPAFLADLKSKFRQAIITYNSSGNNVLRWELDPEKEVATMSLDEKIGSMFAFSFGGTELSDDERSFIQNNHVGGITYFGDNVANQNQVASLSQNIQNLDPKYPVLIATDEEGGTVQRLYWDDSKGGRDIGNLSETDQCNLWKHRSSVLQQAGINWNLGIIADVTSDQNSFIYDRTLSGDFNAAATDVKTAVDCTPSILSTVKHWPGHGSTEVNTHLGLGHLNLNGEDSWKQRDFLPFQAGITANADSIMQGQLLADWFDPNTPASISAVSANYLRNTLGFKGLIVTDALDMLEAAGYSLEDAVKQAMLSGNDILFVVNIDNGQNADLVQLSKDLVTSGQITTANLDERIKIILEKKNKIITSEKDFIKKDLIY